MIFQDFIIKQLTNAGFTEADATKIFTEHDELFVQAFTQPNIYKILGGNLLHSALFFHLFPDADSKMITLATQKFEEILSKEGKELGFHNYVIVGENQNKENDDNIAKNAIKSFCGVLGVILKHDSIGYITQMVTDPIQATMEWINASIATNIDLTDVNSLKNPLMALKELWDVIHFNKRKFGKKFKNRKDLMFRVVEKGDVFIVKSCDPFLSPKNKNKILLTVKNTNKKTTLDEAARKTIDYLYSNEKYRKQIKKGKKIIN